MNENNMASPVFMKINLISDLLTSVNKVIFQEENYLIMFRCIDVTLIRLTSELEIMWKLLLKEVSIFINIYYPFLICMD